MESAGVELIDENEVGPDVAFNFGSRPDKNSDGVRGVMPVKRLQHAAVTSVVVPVLSYYGYYIRSYDQGEHAAGFEKAPSSSPWPPSGKPDRRTACIGPAFLAANGPPNRCQPHRWEVAAAWSDGSGERFCEFPDRDNLVLT